MPIFSNNEQASIALFTAVFCFTHAQHNLIKLKLYNKAICKPRHWNLGIGIGIRIGTGTDITNVNISSSIRPMYPKRSRLVTQNEETPTTKSRDSAIS